MVGTYQPNLALSSWDFKKWKRRGPLQMLVMEMHVGLDLSSLSLLLLDIWLQLTDNLQTSKKVVIQILDTFVSKHMFNLKALISFKTLQHLKALTGWEGTSNTLNCHSSCLSCRCWWWCWVVNGCGKTHVPLLNSSLLGMWLLDGAD